MPLSLCLIITFEELRTPAPPPGRSWRWQSAAGATATSKRRWEGKHGISILTKTYALFALHSSHDRCRWGCGKYRTKHSLSQRHVHKHTHTHTHRHTHQTAKVTLRTPSARIHHPAKHSNRYKRRSLKSYLSLCQADLFVRWGGKSPSYVELNHTGWIVSSWRRRSRLASRYAALLTSRLWNDLV